MFGVIHYPVYTKKQARDIWKSGRAVLVESFERDGVRYFNFIHKTANYEFTAVWQKEQKK